LVLGVRLALANGRVIKTGGKVVKNVAGYDLSKLVIGSLGTLAVITEISVRLRPVPADRRTLLFGFADADAALGVAESVLNSELLPAAVVVLSPEAAGRLEAPGPASLAVALEETKENNDYQEERLVATAGSAAARTLMGEEDSAFWSNLTNYGDRFGASFGMKVNTVIGELRDQMQAEGLEAIAYAGSGTLMCYGFDDGPGAVEAVERRFEAAAQCGGSAVLESGPVELRRKVDVWGPRRPEWRLTQALKKTFDAQKVLNRGRYVGGI
jgi:glycolate oxidase FAD binding subunit